MTIDFGSWNLVLQTNRFMTKLHSAKPTFKLAINSQLV